MYNYPQSNQNFKRPMNYINNNQDDRFIGGGFLGPFLLGGLTGGLVSPLFYGGGYNRPYYNNYYYYPPYPPYPQYPPYRPYYR